MSICSAALAIFSLACVMEGITIWGLSRRIVALQSTRNSLGLPEAGFSPALNDPVQEGFGWPANLLTGDRFVVMVTNGCGPCSKIIAQVHAGRVPLPVHLVTSAGDLSDAYYVELTRANPSSVTVTSNSLTTLNGWKNPTAFPAVFELSDGVIVNNTHDIRVFR